MANPVTVEVTAARRYVESRHRGAVVAVDGDGKVVFRWAMSRQLHFAFGLQGDAGAAAGRKRRRRCYGFGDRELALACSHNGEDEHVAVAASMLARAGAMSRRSNAAATGRRARRC